MPTRRAQDMSHRGEGKAVLVICQFSHNLSVSLNKPHSEEPEAHASGSRQPMDGCLRLWSQGGASPSVPRQTNSGARHMHALSIRSCFFAGTCGKAEISKMRTPSSTGGTIDHYVKPLLLGVFSLLVQVKDTTCKYLTPEEYEVEQQNNRDAVSIGQYYRQSRSNGRCLRLIYALIQILSYY